MPKQNIFISHAGDDKPIVSLLERYLKRNWFTNLVEVFATSLPDMWSQASGFRRFGSSWPNQLSTSP